MSALRHAWQGWSPREAISQWWRDWSDRGSPSELRCCAEEEIARMAKEAGLSVSELHSLARKGPHAADLLLRRMTALGLDPNEVSRTERATFQDMQRVCSMCASHRHCAQDLAHRPDNPEWREYCPNAETLTALNAMPWSARAEW